MKMAIIGSGPVGILTAHHFDQLGADVVLFQRRPLGGNLLKVLDYKPNFELTYKNSTISASDFFKEVIVPAGTSLEEFKLTKSGDVLRVHKRFVHPHEEIKGHTRMFDLFRVIFATNPKENILKQLAENPEMFEKLGPEVIESLHKPVESFADFDIVISATGLGRKANYMGASLAPALNELNLEDCGLIHYEADIFSNLKIEKQKSITIVGEGVTAKLAILKLKDWLLADTTRELHWVTYKSKDDVVTYPWLDKEFEDFFKIIKADFDKNKDLFATKLHSWRDLEDYEKVKIPKPVEPKAQILVYEGYDVTSVDRLLDRDGLYITIESPNFRAHSLKINDIITLSSECVLVARGVNQDSGHNTHFEANEPGYYAMNVTNLNDLDAHIKVIEEDILKFFSKA